MKRITSPGSMYETGVSGWCSGMTQRDGMGWGIQDGETHVHLWCIHVNVWQNHYNNVISLQIKKNKFILKKEINKLDHSSLS